MYLETFHKIASTDDSKRRMPQSNFAPIEIRKLQAFMNKTSLDLVLESCLEHVVRMIIQLAGKLQNTVPIDRKPCLKIRVQIVACRRQDDEYTSHQVPILLPVRIVYVLG